MSTDATTAEEAAAKAKEIASRLMSNAMAASSNQADSSTTATATKAPTERKRKRWGSAADSVAPAVEALPGLAEAARKRQMQIQQGVGSSPTNGGTNTKRVWVPTSNDKPETHFASYLKDRLPDLSSRINNDEFKGDEKNKIELGGRGASTEVVIGMPLEPLHILIHGSDEFIEAAVPKLDDLLVEAEKAEREGPPPEAGSSHYLENSSSVDYSTALTLTRPYHSDTMAANGSRQSGYKPATVAQLISGNPNALNPTMGVPSDELLEETINIPNGVVGFIIGRGGETISSLQARTGCKVQIQKEHELQPGQANRIITLQGSSQESIDTCREMIESMVKERVIAAGGSIGRDDKGHPVDAKVSEALAAGHALVTMDVPDADVGLIIGKGGATIKSIQDFSQSTIQIPPVGNPDDSSVRTISITSPTREGAEAAKARIESLLTSKPSYASRGSAPNTSRPQITMEMIVPDKDVGLCIGRQGCVIKEMQNKTGTRIQIPSHPTMGQPHRVATISGTPEGCEHARSLIERIITEQTSACVMSGAPLQNNNQQGHSQEQQSNDPAWQAYYAAQALAQQQQQQQQPSVAGGQAPDAYYEQFFRYAYYYGEDAARQYYGSWSPAVGTPNPYGVNPNPSPAPAADAASGHSEVSQSSTAHSVSVSNSTVPSTGATPSSVRETSVRKVSNLPAWMTKS